MDYALTKCPNCGKLIINAENFCPKCGCNIKTINKDELTINLVDDNDAERIYMIGEDYFYGNNGRIQSDIKAFEQYEKAATFGHTKAIFSKGWMYYYGRGVQQNLTSAFDCFQSAAKKGNMYAQKYVGECYWNGWGVVQDHESAKEWYYKAAIQGEHESEFWVGIYYFNKGYKETAFQWYLKSAESGFRAAQIAVAGAYILEQGVAKNYNKSKYWYDRFLENCNAFNTELSDLEVTLRNVVLDAYSSHDRLKSSYLVPVTGDYFLPMSDGYCHNADRISICQYCARRTWNGSYYGESGRCQCLF